MARAYIRNSSKYVRIIDVTNKTGFSEQVIINVLKDAGFYVPHNVTFFPLNKKHLTVLSAYYIDAVKQLFADTKRNHQSLRYKHLKHLEQLRNFFTHFIHSYDYTFDGFNSYQNLSIEDVLNSKLDSDLIRSFFFRIVNSVPNNQSNSNNFGYIAFRISRSINLRFRNVNNDLRAKLYTIISNHSHIFTDEENHISFANSRFSFSNMNTNLREATINLKFNLKQKLLCQNIHYL